MAKKSGGSQHSIHGGLSSKAAEFPDASMTIKNNRSVNQGATRDSVATTHGTAKGGGKLK